MKNIGLFGGTFDPAHMGHLIVAQTVIESVDLDKIIFIPSANPPHKSSDIMFSAEDRYAMLSAAIDGNPGFEICDIEMKRTGPSYTIDTLNELKMNYQDNIKFYFIIGKDNLYEISSWKDPEAILDACTLLVANRPSVDSRTIDEWIEKKAMYVTVPNIEISSSDIRSRLRDGKSIRYLVPEAVRKIIEK